jgi:signal transduction histidine kinase
VAWLAANPFTADALLAGLLAVLLLPGIWITPRDVDYRDPDVLAVVLVLAGTLPLAWRRRRTMAALVTVAIAWVSYIALGYAEGGSAVPVLVALYTVAAHCPRRPSLLAAGLTAVGVLVALLTTRGDVTPDAFVGNFVIFGTAWILGDNLHHRRVYVTGLETRAERLEREREEQAQRAVTAERTRIARELHDVVAHSVSVMVVQAGAARRVLRAEPAKAEEALASVEQVGRQSLNELRRLLGVLRRDDDRSFGRTPQPSIEALGDLLNSTRKAGLPVHFTVEGTPRPVPPGVDLSAYRIVQEALTNALKHAGPATAAVHLRYDADDLHVVVTDDGRGSGAIANGDGDGKGLVGMKERVTMCGGELTAGHLPEGGFAIRARLPLQAAS